MKHLKATKCGLQDEWLIEITEKAIVNSKSDVLKTIRQNGLILRPQFTTYKLDKEGKNTKEIIKFFAD